MFPIIPNVLLHHASQVSWGQFFFPPNILLDVEYLKQFETIWLNSLYTRQGTDFIMSWRKELWGGSERGQQKSRPIKTRVFKKKGI